MLLNKYKTNKKSQMDIIYASDEKTRRAIDSLYVAKAERTKMVVALVVLCLLIGFGAGFFVSAKSPVVNAQAVTAQTDGASQLKVPAQSK